MSEPTTPAKVAERDSQEQHRRVFNERAFGIDTNGNSLDNRTVKNNVIHLTQEQWTTIVEVLSKWKTKEEASELSPEDAETFSQLKKKYYQDWYRWHRKYVVSVGELPDGSQVRTLLRKENGKDPSSYQLCLPMLKIFDAISECHRAAGHMGQERTHTSAAAKYYNVTQELVKIFCTTCPECQSKQPSTTHTKGAKKPILSERFRDRFQIDLIDMRKKKKQNIYGVDQCWIMTVKDHYTGITHVCSLPRKRPRYVAHELDKLFGFIGYPNIFHTDNGKEFTGKQVIEALRQLNPAIISVTGRPRTPRDQGSVENMNKLVKRVLGAIEQELRLQGIEPNWTSLLGRVMAAINTHESRQPYSVPAYKAVFGQDYHIRVSCTQEDANKCYYC